MAPRPYNPLAELDAALDRGDLKFSISLAKKVAEDRRKPIDLDLALRFLPLVAALEVVP